MKAMKSMKHGGGHTAAETNYRRLLVMSLLSFVSMYVLMYAMVASFSDVFSSLNQVYMAGLMTAPMVAIELLLMSAMYPKKRLNVALLALSAAAGLSFWFLIRHQTAISDRQFLRSMIPHHGGAVLMCEEAPLQDPALKDLCARIVASQRSEIEFMKSKLNQ